MPEGADAQAVQPLLKSFYLGGSGVHGHAYAAHKQAALLECIDETQNVQIIGDAIVTAHLAADDVLSVDDDNDLGLILQLQQHLQLGIGLAAGQHAGGVVVIEQLAAEFQIQLVVELRDPLPDVLRLHLQVFVVVKSFFHSLLLFLISVPISSPGSGFHGGSVPGELHNTKTVYHIRGAGAIKNQQKSRSFRQRAFAGKSGAGRNSADYRVSWMPLRVTVSGSGSSSFALARVSLGRASSWTTLPHSSSGMAKKAASRASGSSTSPVTCRNSI